jgi:hypothetical protein
LASPLLGEGDSVKVSARKLKAALGYEILDYLLRHPDAQDTIEGIIEWWLLEQRIIQAKAEIERAVEELALRQLVITRRTRDGRIHYQLNRRKKKQIAAMLKDRPRTR